MGSAPYRLVDIGANLVHKSFKAGGVAEVLARAKDSGVSKIIVTGTCLKTSHEAHELSAEHENYLYSTCGVHPHDAKHFDEGTVRQLEDLAAKDGVVAIGECGLDFNRNFSPPDQQLAAFDAQVQLACRLQKPLFVHERDAHDAVVEILSRHRPTLPPCVIHCFTGTTAQATAYIGMGLYIGLTGFLWKERGEGGVRQALRTGALPLDRLLVETDAPFIYPKVTAKSVPADVAGRVSEHASRFLRHCSFARNEPCALPAVVELIAAFADVDAGQLAEATTVNASRVFGLA